MFIFHIEKKKYVMVTAKTLCCNTSRKSNNCLKPLNIKVKKK